MIAFIIPAGTKALVIKVGQEWYGQNFRSHTTRRENMFFREDVVVDPIGTIGSHRGHAKTVGGSFASRGYYGFRDDNSSMILLVPASEVRTG